MLSQPLKLLLGRSSGSQNNPTICVIIENSFCGAQVQNSFPLHLLKVMSIGIADNIQPSPASGGTTWSSLDTTCAIFCCRALAPLVPSGEMPSLPGLAAGPLTIQKGLPPLLQGVGSRGSGVKHWQRGPGEEGLGSAPDPWGTGAAPPPHLLKVTGTQAGKCLRHPWMCQ